MKTYGEWKYSSTFLDLSTRWRRVVSFTARTLYPRYPSDSRVGGPQSRSGCCEQEKHLALAGNQTPAVQSLTSCYTDWVIKINEWQYNMCVVKIHKWRATITKERWKGLQVIKGLSRWIEGFKGRETLTETHGNWEHETDWTRRCARDWSRHLLACEKLDIRFIYVFALFTLILRYRRLVSYSVVGSYYLAADAWGLEREGQISGVRYVSGTCFSVIWETWSDYSIIS
jgi:hypothetical protein